MMPVTVDILVQSPLWNAQQAETTVREAIAAAVAAEPKADGELSVVLTDDAAIRELNRLWRKIDKPTNVLSFPAKTVPGSDVQLGDIVIAHETLAAEAAAEAKPFDHHLAHLTVHGFLHLLGYDHENDSDADVMEDRERAVLARLAVPDPYSARQGSVD